MTSQLQRLNRETHIHYALADDVRETAILEYCHSLLSESERQRYLRFRFPGDRHCYLLAHAMVRLTLSEYIDIAPSAWTFTSTVKGRPEIANLAIPPVNFNLTHTGGFVACVISLDKACGIDAELIRQRNKLTGVARKMFSPGECKHLSSLQGDQALEYFYSRWTLREAYIKALGTGLSYPVNTLYFDRRATGSITMEYLPEDQSTQGHWQFDILRLTPQHITAVALQLPEKTRKPIIARRLSF